MFLYHSPLQITEPVKKLLESFDTIKYEIVYVPIKTEPKAKKSECYYNVADKIESAGGKIRYGWSVYDNDYFIEAEKHAIWESPEGDLIDVSPSNSEQIDQIMFIIDDINEGINVPNIRNNYIGSKAIDDYFIFNDVLDVLTFNYGIESANFKGFYTFPPQLDESVRTLNDLILDYIDYIKSNANGCICGSVKFYEACHYNKIVPDLIDKIDRIIIDNNLQRKL